MATRVLANVLHERSIKGDQLAKYLRDHVKLAFCNSWRIQFTFKLHHLFYLTNEADVTIDISKLFSSERTDEMQMHAASEETALQTLTTSKHRV